MDDDCGILTEHSERIPLWCFYEETIFHLGKDKHLPAMKFLRQMVNKKTPFIIDQLPDIDMSWRADPSRVFLPFPNCWLECPAMVAGERGRSAIVIADSNHLNYLFVGEGSNKVHDLFGDATLWIEEGEVVVELKTPSIEWQRFAEKILKFFLHHINTPHHGLYHTVRKQSFVTRERAKKLKLYPLAAITEIVLSQAPPEPKRIMVTGTGSPKCQHDVRAHKRVYHKDQPNQFEVLVPSHRRGDPKLGIKKSKYKVETE